MTQLARQEYSVVLRGRHRIATKKDTRFNLTP